MINKKILNLSQDSQDNDKGDYKHFMAKEIDEQPTTIKNCVNEYIDIRIGRKRARFCL